MYTPPEVAAWLGIAPVTLRKWAMKFHPWLSPSVTQVSRGVARRYTDADLAVLSQIHAYLTRNFTYTEIQSLLRNATAAEQALLASPPIPALPALLPPAPALVRSHSGGFPAERSTLGQPTLWDSNLSTI